MYSLGCILFELCTGARPFEGKQWNTVQFANMLCVKKQRPSFSGNPAAPAVAPELRRLIESCWEADPARRPSAVDLVTSLSAMYLGPKMPPHPDKMPALQKLIQVARRHGVREDWIPSLRNLEAFDVCFICDDSGSMSSTTHVGAETITRWEELKRSVKLVSDIAAAVDSDGCDV